MNRFDERYDIRFATMEEIPEIMEFIDLYWKKNHILSRDRKFFYYEMVIDDHVNVLIARDKRNNRMDGILGFLPASKDKERLDIWGVIWKTLDDAMPMLGMELKKRLIQYTGARTELGTGANPKTSVPLLRMLMHYYTAKMKHYYCLSERETYIIAKVEHKEKMQYNKDMDLNVKRIWTIEEAKELYDFSLNQKVIPYKDAWYVDRRYFKHPLFQYMIFGLSEKNDKTKALIIFREQEQNGERILRIVDYMGEDRLFAGLGSFFGKQLEQYEYLDFYFDGFNESYVKRAGMIELEEKDTNIIPNYFAPFEQKNVDIWVDSSSKNCIFFKADGDQDRPS